MIQDSCVLREANRQRRTASFDKSGDEAASLIGAVINQATEDLKSKDETVRLDALVFLSNKNSALYTIYTPLFNSDITPSSFKEFGITEMSDDDVRSVMRDLSIKKLGEKKARTEAKRAIKAAKKPRKEISMPSKSKAPSSQSTIFELID